MMKKKNEQIKMISTEVFANNELLLKKFNKIIDTVKAMIIPIPPALKSFLLGCFLLEGLSKILYFSPIFKANGTVKLLAEKENTIIKIINSRDEKRNTLFSNGF